MAPLVFIYKWIIGFLLMLFCSVCIAQTPANWYSIKAFLPNWNHYVAELKVDGQTVHTDTVRADMFSYIDTISGVHEGIFQIKKGSSVVAVPLFVERGTIKVVDKGYNQLLPSGTVTNDAYQNLINHITASALIHYGYDYDKVNAYKSQLCINYINQNRRSVLSLHLLKYYPFLRQQNDSLYNELYNLLDPSVKASYLGKQMGEAQQVQALTAIGTKVPAMQLPDTLNQLAPLYDKDKYTLVEFWASWCTPCRIQHPGLIKVFDSFHTKGFTVVSVSLDSDKNRWLNAIKKDKLAWKHLSDLKGWESAVVKVFNINAVPMNLLLDDKGIIIAKNLRAETLTSKLNQMLQ